MAGYGIATGGKTGASGLGLTNTGKGQLSPQRVVSVILDDSHPYYEGIQSIGRIFYENPSSGFNIVDGEREISAFKTAQPITPNAQFYPVIGEVVFVIGSLSDRQTAGGAYRHSGWEPQKYYFPPLRLSNESSHNSIFSKYINDEALPEDKQNRAIGGTPNKRYSESPTFKLGEYFQDRGIQRLLPYEGDYILEGRFGNSIRFGSTTPHTPPDEKGPSPNPWSRTSIDGEDSSDQTKAQTGDPITIIRNGQAEIVPEKVGVPTLEDINGDHSSIYMCSNQRLENFRVAGVTTSSPDQIDMSAYLETDDSNDSLIPTPNYGMAQIVLSAATGIPAEGIDALLAGLNEEEVVEETEVPTAPILPTNYTSSREDETDDGLSFYNEMVIEQGGVVAADHFIEEVVDYEDTTVSATELPNHRYIADGDGNEENNNGGNCLIYGEEVHDPPIPAGYPCKIPYRYGSDYYVNLEQPKTISQMVARIKAGEFNVNMSTKKYIALHTSAGVTGHKSFGNWFMQQYKDFSCNRDGWRMHGYHLTIDPQGTCVETYAKNSGPHVAEFASGGYTTWGVGGATNISAGFPGGRVTNSQTINICWGGVWPNMTIQQADAFKQIVKAFLSIKSTLQVLGHNQVSTKGPCPYFYVPAFCRNIGIPAANIYEHDGHKNHPSLAKYAKVSGEFVDRAVLVGQSSRGKDYPNYKQGDVSGNKLKSGV